MSNRLSLVAAFLLGIIVAYLFDGMRPSSTGATNTHLRISADTWERACAQLRLTAIDNLGGLPIDPHTGVMPVADYRILHVHVRREWPHDLIIRVRRADDPPIISEPDGPVEPAKGGA